MKKIFLFFYTALCCIIIGSQSASAQTDPFAGNWYRLKNRARGTGECLEGNQPSSPVHNGAAFMDKQQNVTGQIWKLEKQPNGLYRLKNKFRGDGESLEGNEGGSPIRSGAAFMDKNKEVSGQLWKVIPEANYYRLETQLRSTAENLEGNEVASRLHDGAAFMDKRQDVGGQQWLLEKIEAAEVAAAKDPVTVPATTTAGMSDVGNPANTPGAREYSLTWTDASGNLWLMGGRGRGASGQAGYMNDLWKYDVKTGNWTWKKGSSKEDPRGIYGTKGVAAATSAPGARWRSVTWTDAAGNLWLFGGEGNPEGPWGGFLNDLWKYDVQTGNWTWVTGTKAENQAGVYGMQGMPDTGNTPSARANSTAWTDAGGNLWLFGGEANTPAGRGVINDLWKYDTKMGAWTWVKGSNTINQAGAYGTMGTAAAGNIPGARNSATSWVDGSGNLWLFGGSTHGSDISQSFNDLWKYDTKTGNWAWMKGNNTINGTGTNGFLGVAAAANNPAPRRGAGSWTDGSGNLWLVGGYSNLGGFNMNDLWKYDVKSGNWAWVKGGSGAGDAGEYGTKGVETATNVPASRNSQASWKTGSYLWMFGGNGNNRSGMGSWDDLWRYNPATGNWTWVKGTNMPNPLPVFGTQVTP